MRAPDEVATEHSSPATGSGQLLRNAVLVIAIIAVLWGIRWLKPVLVPLVLGIFITFWLTPIVDRLERWRLPRPLGAAVVLLALVAGLAGIAYTFRDDAAALFNGLPEAARHAQAIFNDVLRDRTGWLHHLRTALAQTGPSSIAGSADVPGTLMDGSRAVVATALNFGLVFFLVYFLLASGDFFKRRLLRIVSGGLSRRRVTVTMIEEIGQQLQRYLGVLAITNVAIGLLTGMAFWALGLERAAVWGIATAVIHVIPYVGAAVIAGAAGFVSAVQFESFGQGLGVACVTLGISTLVGMLLTTWLASRASSMNSVAVFVGLLFWGWLWGISGLLLGTPLMMAIKVLLDHFAPMRAVSIFLSGAMEAKPLQSRG